MKIVILDGYTLNPGDLSWNEIELLGELKVYDRTPSDMVIERIEDAEIVLTNKVILSRDILENTPSVKYIGVMATGYNVVDLNAANELGIIVTNVPSYSTSSVAQFVFALILEFCHHIGEHNSAVQNGEWTKSKDFTFRKYTLIELANKTMGIVGFGAIGQATAKLAAQFGMKVLVYNRTKRIELETENIKFAEFEEILTQSDFLSLHCPLTETTKGIINSGTISKMKDGAVLINTARGPILVEQDVADALNSEKLSGACIDVASIEPITSNNPLLSAKNCIITPHIAWATQEARMRLMGTLASNIKGFINKKPINVVNR